MTNRIRLMREQDAMERVSKVFDAHNPEAAKRRIARLAKAEKVRAKPVVKAAKKSTWQKEFDENLAEINRTLARLQSKDFGEQIDIPVPQPSAVPIGDVLGDESLGTQSGRMEKSEKDVILYDSLVSMGTVQKAVAAGANGGNVMKADAAETGIDLCKIYI